MGVGFFQRAMGYVEKHARPRMTFEHTTQTNGTLLDDEWAAFFKEHNFLIGISIHGPRELHDVYPVDKGAGRRSTRSCAACACCRSTVWSTTPLSMAVKRRAWNWALRFRILHQRGTNAKAKTAYFWLRDNASGLTPEEQARLFNTALLLGRPRLKAFLRRSSMHSIMVILSIHDNRDQ